jgi:formate dehydrogenase subunit gamma
MKHLSRLCLALLLGISGAALAQQSVAPKDDGPATREEAQQQRQVTQPGNNAPVWREVQSGTPNYTSLPGRERGVLIQPPARFLGQDNRTTAGEAWRQFRNGPMTFYGGWLVLLALIAIAALYFTKGAVKLHDAPTGRKLLRFTPSERIVHWSVAISFCILGISGLIMLFGKYILLPVIGYTLFGWLGNLSKNLHNFVAPFFMVSVLVMVAIWIRDNLPKSYDFKWFSGAWAFFTRGKHIASGRFNAGEKAWFWIGVVALSVVVSWSGLILLFPNFDQTRATMQDAWIWHASAALLYIAMSLGHIYMGTIGVEGAYGNMREGYTDETWAKEHHEYWYNEVKSGQSRAPGGAVPAGAPHMREKS